MIFLVLDTMKTDETLSAYHPTTAIPTKKGLNKRTIDAHFDFEYYTSRTYARSSFTAALNMLYSNYAGLKIIAIHQSVGRSVAMPRNVT